MFEIILCNRESDDVFEGLWKTLDCNVSIDHESKHLIMHEVPPCKALEVCNFLIEKRVAFRCTPV